MALLCVMCVSCLKKWKEGQEEKKRETIKDLISKYLANKDPDILVLIRRICCEAYWIESFLDRRKKVNLKYMVGDKTQVINRFVLDKAIKERPECVDYIKTLINSSKTPYIEKSQDFLRACRSEYQDAVNFLESSKEPGLSNSELDEIAGDIKMWEIILNFLDDLEKIDRLFKKRGIEATAFEILSIFFEVIREIANKEQNMPEQELDKILDQWHGGISEILENLELPITKENVIKAYLVSWMTSDSEEYNVDVVEDVKTVSRLLNKFNFTCEADEVKELIEKIKEEIELEEFEQNLGTPPQKQKIEIGDFTQLNGYEFEEYLKNLFELLGYTAVQTPSSGDQGADLILSKDDEKIVVQAKKYDGKVSNKAVQEIAAAKNYYNTDRAMVVTNSSFTKSAIELAFSNDVELWDGRKLKNVIEDLEKGKR